MVRLDPKKEDNDAALSGKTGSRIAKILLINSTETLYTTMALNANIFAQKRAESKLIYIVHASYWTLVSLGEDK